MNEKIRLDQYLVSHGLAQSRERAKSLIMEGCVFVNQQKFDKAGELIREDAQVEVRGNTLPYVSRGGLKLDKAMAAFQLSLKDCICMDIGASTGGFTDCMLQNGAKKVYAIDVGYGQLAWSLRTDPRVVNLERTNFRHVTSEQIPEPIDFASVDVSFISLTIILPVARQLLKDNCKVVCLVKPQFEAGKGKVGKKGVVRDPAIHLEVVKRVTGFCVDNGWRVLGLDYSPIKGPEGNIEYLLCLQKAEAGEYLAETTPEQIVADSHGALSAK
ncbi:TlyA family RNA methyltransferase [Zongyangia hominis]|uniref:TlyA family RNA methyltransferase n=1 Tax=Zongyangia hominis TaxID=2763677 RepID=A0A926I635_9FIRM|nr:TlyA family RNA methyltransferase [Zongyangia hominis]MBC8569594.1 TlyA family RNA methyltransferase [Zongyangia hominis]